MFFVTLKHFRCLLKQVCHQLKQLEAVHKSKRKKRIFFLLFILLTVYRSEPFVNINHVRNTSDNFQWHKYWLYCVIDYTLFKVSESNNFLALLITTSIPQRVSSFFLCEKLTFFKNSFLRTQWTENKIICLVPLERAGSWLSSSSLCPEERIFYHLFSKMTVKFEREYFFFTLNI